MCGGIDVRVCVGGDRHQGVWVGVLSHGLSVWMTLTSAGCGAEALPSSWQDRDGKPKKPVRTWGWYGLCWFPLQNPEM